MFITTALCLCTVLLSTHVALVMTVSSSKLVHKININVLPPPRAEGRSGRIFLLHASVVLPAAPNCIERAAATELRTEIAQLTGARGLPPLLYEPQPVNSSTTRVFVGNTTAARNRAPLPPLPPHQALHASPTLARAFTEPPMATATGGLRAEEGVVVAADGDLFVFGDDTGAPAAPTPDTDACSSVLGPDLPGCVGAMSAVYPTGCRGGTFFAAAHLLRHVLGVRWIWPGSDGVVRADPDPRLSVDAALAARTAPALALRRMRPDPMQYMPLSEARADIGDWFDTTTAANTYAEEGKWMLRNGLGGRTTVPWGQAFEGAWEKYGKEHADWFALAKDGSRGCQHIQDCDDHPQFVKVDTSSQGMAAHVASLLAPGALGVSACEDDSNSGFCTCAKCALLDPEERASSPSGKYSDRYTYFWNNVHRELRQAGHPNAWVGAYAYESYTDPPMHQRFDNASKVLVLSVGFGSVLDADNSTLQSRAGWSGWVGAGARGMAMRPNSLWADYTGLPFVFSEQWLDDVQWCGARAMYAADFDSLVGNYAAVGPSYYALARTLWNPANANRTAILQEYYSSFGHADRAMRDYHGFWRNYTQAVYTDPAILAIIAAFENRSSNTYVGADRAQYVMAGMVYTPHVVMQASVLLAVAEQSCGTDPGHGGDRATPAAAAAATPCSRVAKSRTHLDYTTKMAAAANATAPPPNFHHRGPASDFTMPSEAMVVAGQALQKAAHAIAGKHIVNTYYTLAKANERADLLGLLVAQDAPSAQPAQQRTRQMHEMAPTSTAAGIAGLAGAYTVAYMLSTQYWFMALDPADKGVVERWFLPSFPHTTAWNRSAVGCPAGCGSAATDAWAKRHGGESYRGVSWWSVNDLCNQNGCATLLGDKTTTKLYLKDGSNASSITLWLNGVMLGGCTSWADCKHEMLLDLPRSTSSRPRPRAGKSVLVVRVNTTATGTLRRLFALREKDKG